MGGLESCIVCLNRQLAAQNGEYQYQVFKKIPFFGALKDYQKIHKGIKALKGQPGSSLLDNIGKIIGQTIPGLQRPMPEISPGGALPQPQPKIDPSIFVNNLVNLKPLDSVKGVETIFEIAGASDDTFVKKIKKSNYSEVLKSMQGTNRKFNDIQFPPNQQSLGKVSGINTSNIKWMRITQILKDPVFVSDNIHPNDILQGALGDCYFLSAIASLAEQQYRIRNIFPSLEINPHGIYMARVLYNGLYQQVVVDDFFPVNQRGDPIFAKPAGKRQIWVMVLQKIWAKLFGSYANIVGGLPQEVLHAFSSAPVFLKTIPSDSKKLEDLWKLMVEEQKNGALLCCGTKSDPKIQELGFVKGHAYTILGVYEKPFRLIKVRNPWGHKQWTGRASDYDLDFWNQVSPADKQVLEYEDSKRSKDKDGVFFLVWQDFIKYFQLVDLCKINDNAHYNFLQSDFLNANAKLFQFEIRGKESNATYAVTQSNKRGTTNQYARSFLVLGKWDEQSKTYKFVKSCSDKRMADNYLELKGASPGKYILYVKYLWAGGATNKAVVSIYSESLAQVTELKGGINSQTFLNQIFYDHASKNSKLRKINDKGDWVCSDIMLNEGGFSYFVANVTKGSNMKLGVTLNESQYIQKKLQLLPLFKGRQEIKEQVNQSKPLIVVAQLLVSDFPQKISSPSAKIVTLK